MTRSPTDEGGRDARRTRRRAGASRRRSRASAGWSRFAASPITRTARSSSRTPCSGTSRTSTSSRGKDEKKIGKYIVGRARPGQGEGLARVHLQVSGRSTTPQPTRFVNINASPLDGILGGGSGGGFAAGRGGRDGAAAAHGSALAMLSAGGRSAATPAAPLGPVWSGLTAVAALGGAALLPGSGAMSPIAGRPGGGPTAGGGPPDTQRLAARTTSRRFEFVVMLVWREPVPKIEPNPDAAVPAAAASVPRSVTEAQTDARRTRSGSRVDCTARERTKPIHASRDAEHEEQRRTQEAPLLDPLRAGAAVRADRRAR